MSKKTIRDMQDLKGKKILVRCDFNVPMKDGEIKDDTRIKGALPTIKFLMDQGAKVILCSHLGKPKPKEMTKEEMKAKFTLNPVAKRLSEQLGTEVKFADDLTGSSANDMVNGLKEGEVGLLENTRFDVRETSNDGTLSLELANLADGYVNDAFGSAHRAHSSTQGVAEAMISQGKETALGFLMEREVEELGAVLESPEQPFVAILGGAKVSDKIGVIENLMTKVEKIVIGGAMANTFLKAKGYDIGSSKYEAEKLEIAKDIMKKAIDQNVELVLPVDARIAKISAGAELTPETVESAEHKKVKLYTDKQVAEGKGESLEGWQILDVGDTSLDYIADSLEGAKTVAWNGPLGYTEAPTFAIGTAAVAKFIASTGARCVIGGGDSVAAINNVKKEAIENGENPKQFNNIYLSTGGGASLEFLEGKELPGIAIVDEKQHQATKASDTSKQCLQDKIVE